MKYKLKAPNKQFSSEELIADLKEVADQLNQSSVSIREYSQYGRYSPQTLKKRFGSWAKAVKKADLEMSKRSWGGSLEQTAIPEESLIADLQKVAKDSGKESITMEDYDKHGKYSTSAISKRWGGWNRAKEKAGLSVGRAYNSTDEDYFNNLAKVWEELGRQPRYQEMIAPLSKLHVSSYERRYGSWRNTLEKFISFMESTGNQETKAVQKTTTENKKVVKKTRPPLQRDEKKIEIKRTNRTANLRQRYRAMKRDNFRCVVCGASPATEPGIKLEIDHIMPWSEGGETIEENLQTLCQNCNQGKSNL